MKIFRNILLIALALLLQSTLIGSMSVQNVRPDLAMLLLFLLVNVSGSVESILYGFLIGFVQDVYSPEFLGANAFTMSLMAFLIVYSKERLTVENYTVKATITFFTCVLHDLIYLSFYTQFDFSMIINDFLIFSILGAVYTTILMIVTVAVINWAMRGGVYFVVQGLFGDRQ